MESNNDNLENQENGDDSGTKISLKMPSPQENSGPVPPETLSLKKPEDSGPPGTLSLKKPEEISSGPPGTLTLKKPEEVNLSPPGTLSLKKPEEVSSPGTLSLKKPGEITSEIKEPPGDNAESDESGPPATLTIRKPNESAGSNMDEMGETKMNVKIKSLDTDESKLTEPGNLTLKTPSEISDAPNSNDEGGGLRLRKPSAPETPEEVDLDDTAVNLNDKEESEESDQGVPGLQMRKPNQESSDNTGSSGSGLSLKKPEPQEVSTPSVLPPGLELPPGTELPVDPPPSSDEPPTEESTTATDSENDEKPKAPPETAEVIAFATKQKKGLTKKQKLQIFGIWLPMGLVIAFLMFMFFQKLFTTKAKKPEKFGDQEAELQEKKAALKAKKKAEKEAAAAAKKAAREAAIVYFPVKLQLQLREEYGSDAEKQFMEEWEGLPNSERKKYLKEIGALTEHEKEKKERMRLNTAPPPKKLLENKIYLDEERKNDLLDEWENEYSFSDKKMNLLMSGCWEAFLEENKEKMIDKPSPPEVKDPPK